MFLLHDTSWLHLGLSGNKVYRRVGGCEVEHKTAALFVIPLEERKRPSEPSEALMIV